MSYPEDFGSVNMPGPWVLPWTVNHLNVMSLARRLTRPSGSELTARPPPWITASALGSPLRSLPTAGPEPRSVSRLVVTVTTSLYVPGLTLIVSPDDAALTAAWIV